MRWRQGGAKRHAGAATALSLFLLATLSPSRSEGAGLYFSDRGVRPLSRGGAFVAGADDLGAMWYNPAGIADAGTSILADFSWMRFSSDYARSTQVADSAGTLRVYDFPGVRGTTPLLPLPTLGGSLSLGEKNEWVGAFGVYAPYTAVTSYPLTVNGAPSPSRYSLVSLDGSALVVPGLYLAYRGIDKLRIGAGVQLLTGSFQSSVVFSASPADRVIAAPEDPTYDALSRLSVGPILAPSANAGLIYELAPWMRVGLSGQLPFWVNSPARVRVRLPNAAPFDNARQEGEDARVRFRLPGAVRLGVEFRPTDTLRVEVGFAREFWGIHDEIEIRPQNIQLTGITGFPSPFGVAPISIPRGFRASNSYRIGGEYRFEVAGYRFDARAGVSYEESAIPRAYLSPLTIDLDKVTVSLGGSLHVGGHWRFDAVYARVFGMGETVSPAEAAVPRVNPVRGNPTQTEAVNGGTYAARADVIGVGLAYRF